MRAAALAPMVAAAALSAQAAVPLAESRCARGTQVDAAFRDAALRALERLAVRAPGLPADGALRTDLAAGHVDADGRPWHRVSAYPANLALLGALATSTRSLPLAERWLRWQARHAGADGIVPDHWIDPATWTQTPCPRGLPAADCAAVDAHDSTAASLLLAADAFHRAGGSAAVLREPALRRALDGAALTLQRLAGPEGLTLAKPDHAVAYTMDQVEVIAGWRAWARLLRQTYAQPASADNADAEAARIEAAVRRHLATPRGWKTSLDAGAPDGRRWYADTVAQAWPLLWLGAPAGQPDAAAAHFRRAIDPWQRPGRDWRAANVDRDGFWWPAIAVAAACTGDDDAARRWVARARRDWMDPRRPFGWPFQVADLLWLLWLAPPESPVSPGEENPR